MTAFFLIFKCSMKISTFLAKNSSNRHFVLDNLSEI